MADVKNAGARANATSADRDTAPDASIGWQLSMAGRLIRSAAEEALAPLGLRNRHFGVLLILATGGITQQGEVAQQALMDKSTMVAVVDHLEGLGFVERRRNPANRRARELILTANGWAALAQAQQRVAVVEERFLAPLDEQARHVLRATLARLLAAQGLA